MSGPGVKVALGHHESQGHASMTGYVAACSCGWQQRVRFVRMMHEAHAQAEMQTRHRDHVRHMTLVHDQQTHAADNCGRLCIYTPPAAPTGEEGP